MKKVLFLVRGLIREARHWGEFLTYIQREMPDFEIVCLDIPGAGVYYQELSPLKVEAMVEHMRADYLKKKGDVNYLVAISLGGMIAGHWLTNFKDDFQKAILINSSFSNLSPIFKRLKPYAIKELSKVLTMSGIERERQIISVVCNRTDRYDKVANLWHEIQATKPVKKINYFRQILAGAQFKLKDHQKPSIPVTVIGSPNDRMVDFSCSEKIAKFWNCKMITHPTAGHDLPSDEPEWVATQVKQIFA